MNRNVASIVMVIGGIIQAIIFGNVTVLIQNMDETRTKLQNKLDSMQSFLKFYAVPQKTIERAIDAVEYSWNFYQVCLGTRL